MTAIGTGTWMPRSPCGDHCLPRPGTAPSVSCARRAARIAAAALVVLAGVGLTAACPALRPRARARLTRGWFRAVLSGFGARLRVIGPPRFAPAGVGTLVVTNHVSWLDIVALNAIQPSHMVAKVEVRGWPVIGWLAAVGGTIFIDRERLHSLPATVAKMAAALRAGECVVVFPEGTTSCGRRFGPYRRASFQAAVDAGVDVRPVAVRFRVGPDGSPTTAAAFVGSGSLWASLCRVAALRDLVVEVEMLPPLLRAGHPNRRSLAAAAYDAVTASSGWRAVASPTGILTPGELSCTPAA
jgi:1-acyl-sn-glycerol-3-phosphate acyltransferase